MGTIAATVTCRSISSAASSCWGRACGRGGPGRGGWHGGGAGAHRGADPEALAGVEIWLRGDSGFCRDELLPGARRRGVEYVLGIAQNPRLKRSLAPEMERARQEYERTGQAARVFKDFRYRTLDSWSRERRVIGKAEHLPRGANPRFVVTSLGAERMARAQCGTIRLKLLKIGVRIRVSVRAVRLSFDEGFPEAGLFGQVLARLQSLPLRC